MNRYIQIASLKPQADNQSNRILLRWIGPDNILREYAINQQSLSRFNSEQELKTAIDQFTSQNFGYVLDDLWVHLNRNGTWAVATGNEPALWPEDQGTIP